DNAIKGTVDVSGWTPPANGTFSISINGMEHTIDLSAISPSEAGNPVAIEDLVRTINSRFQEQGVKAELVKDGADQRLVLWSPQGFSIEATQSGDDATALLGATSAQTENRGGVGAYSQKIAVRTGANQQKTDFFGVIENLANAVRQQDREGINSIMLGKIDDFTDNLLRCRTREGAVQKRYTSNQSRLQQNNLNLTELYSKVSDVDLAEAYTQHKMTEAIYQASLAMMAQIIQPTLVDFLR
ncbi:MAG: flagellin, partial [Aminobacterium sp.]